MDKQLRPLGLSAGLFSVLAGLEGAKGMSGAEIARRCFIKPPTVTVLIATLTQLQLIDRSPSQHHGRIIETRLTQKGVDVLSQAYKICEQIEDDMMAGLSPSDRAMLAQLLASCALHVGKRPD